VLAERVARELVSKAQMLSELPHSGRALAGRQEYRQVVLRVLNARYVFQYRYAADRLVILDLQFGGKDAPENIISTPCGVNCSVGAQGKQRLQYPDGTKIKRFISE
jgi:plasmid stabilization system protein ParE